MAHGRDEAVAKQGGGYHHPSRPCPPRPPPPRPPVLHHPAAEYVGWVRLIDLVWSPGAQAISTRTYPQPTTAPHTHVRTHLLATTLTEADDNNATNKQRPPLRNRQAPDWVDGVGGENVG